MNSLPPERLDLSDLLSKCTGHASCLFSQALWGPGSGAGVCLQRRLLVHFSLLSERLPLPNAQLLLPLLGLKAKHLRPLIQSHSALLSLLVMIILCAAGK